MVGRPCASCEEAERVWLAAATAVGVDIVVRHVSLGGAAEASVPAVPALLVDGATVLVGVPTPADARRVLRRVRGPAG